MDRRKKLSIITIVFAMLGAVIATAGIAAGSDPVTLNRGVLLLYTGDNGTRVDWHAPDSTSPTEYSANPTKTQVISVDSKCNVTLGTVMTGNNAKLVTVTSSGNLGVGMVSHGLGAKTKNNCSTEQGQVALGQHLSIGLGQFFGPRVVVVRAEIDIEGKRNAGLDVTYTPLSGTPYSEQKPLSATSDNGPDSGTSDNNIVTLTPAGHARVMTFGPVMNAQNSPAVSVEGGGDGVIPAATGSLRAQLGTNASVFQLTEVFDGELNCNGETPTAGNATTMQGTFKRLDNRDGSDCVLKPYNLSVSSGGDTLTFDPEDAASGPQLAAYSGIISAPPKASSNPTNAKLEYDPELDGTFVNMQWCTSATIGLDGYVVTAQLPGTEAWCIAAESTVIVGPDGKIRTTWTVYGHDDPIFRGN